jgi:glyoxylase-like metal-dependent hydrolase (beta-lactamase superfamily II)
MRIANNVEMLEIAAMGNVIYPTLTWDDDHLVLIDAGYPGQKGAIAQALAVAGFSASGITHIIITHQDMDHIGCVPDLLRLAPAALTLIHEEEAPYLDGRKTPLKLAALLSQYDSLPAERQAWCDSIKEGYANRIITAGQPLCDGDLLPLCGGIEVIHTPGHTPGHICLYLRQSCILVSGDALNIQDGELCGPNPQYTYEMERGMRSVEKALTRPLNGVVAYHGGYLEIKKRQESI